MSIFYGWYREGLEKMEKEKQKEADRAREIKQREERLRQEKLKNDLKMNQIPVAFDSEPSAYHVKSKFVMPFFHSFCFFFTYIFCCHKENIFSWKSLFFFHFNDLFNFFWIYSTTLRNNKIHKIKQK